MIIRPARQNEYSHLPDIENDAAQAFREAGLDGIDGLEETAASYYKNLPGRSAVFIAEDKGQIIGFSAGYEVDGQAYIREVSVRFTSSGKGAGTALVTALINWAGKTGFSCVTLTTFRDIPFNAPFYRKLGFVPFEPDGNWPELLAIRKKEISRGLDIQPRICMKLDLDKKQ